MAYLIFVVSGMVIFIALATLLHLQFGLTGIVNFGVVGFWGLGMYATGVLQVQYEIPYLLAVIVATLFTGILAYILGWIILDLDSQSILVATLAFATIVVHLVTTEKWLTKGVVGLGTISFPIDFGRRTDLYFLIILSLITIALLLYAHKLRSAPYGRLLLSIQDNEILARSLGKSTFQEKLIFFTITSGLMGFLGALHASVNQFLTPMLLGAGVTFTVWIALILGGKRRVLGGLIGIVVTIGLFDLLIETYLPLSSEYAILVPNIKLMIYGLTLMLILMYRPLGILGDRKNS
ncbi:MAG: branched-chain amino acid ABC transporter permease [Chloroflexota bacterium]